MSHAHPLPRAAGKVLDPSLNDSAAGCLTIEARPPTPEDVRRFRKSFFSAPGARIAHPGLVNDLKALDPLAKFGVVTTSSQHVADVLAHGAAASEHQRLALARSEASYASRRREPLGKSLSRGHALPAATQRPGFAFGVSGTLGESAKELLYPSHGGNSQQDEALYKRSHGSVAPGEQKDRAYGWASAGIDPARHRFGATAGRSASALASAAGGEVAECLSPETDESVVRPAVAAAQVEDRRSTLDHLGRPRHLGAAPGDAAAGPQTRVFGLATRKEELSAWDCIQGDYSAREQQPDDDLGRPVNHGWRNASAEPRAFGVPTVRRDIRAPARRSVADTQNYGDDASGQQLLYPQAFAGYGVADAEFLRPRAREPLRRLFERAGHALPPEDFERLWRIASRRTATKASASTLPSAPALGDSQVEVALASVADFRDALNDLLAARDAGPQALHEWQQAAERLE